MANKAKVEKKLSKKTTFSNKEKKCAKKSSKMYKIYIFKVLRKFILILESRARHSIFKEFARYKKKPTITSWEFQNVGRLVLPGELVKHTVSEGTKAVTKFTS